MDRLLIRKHSFILFHLLINVRYVPTIRRYTRKAPLDETFRWKMVFLALDWTRVLVRHLHLISISRKAPSYIHPFRYHFITVFQMRQMIFYLVRQVTFQTLKHSIPCLERLIMVVENKRKNKIKKPIYLNIYSVKTLKPVLMVAGV